MAVAPEFKLIGVQHGQYITPDLFLAAAVIDSRATAANRSSLFFKLCPIERKKLNQIEGIVAIFH